MNTESAFFDQAHTMCGNKTCVIWTNKKSQQTSDDALGIPSGDNPDDESFTADIVMSVKPKSVTRTKEDGALEMIRGWQAVVRVPEGNEITPRSRVVLQGETEQRTIHFFTPSMSTRLYNLLIS